MSKEQEHDLTKEIHEKIESAGNVNCIVCNKKCDSLICDECKRAIKWARLQMYKIQRIIVKG